MTAIQARDVTRSIPKVDYDVIVYLLDYDVVVYRGGECQEGLKSALFLLVNPQLIRKLSHKPQIRDCFRLNSVVCASFTVIIRNPLATLNPQSARKKVGKSKIRTQILCQIRNPQNTDTSPPVYLLTMLS